MVKTSIKSVWHCGEDIVKYLESNKFDVSRIENAVNAELGKGQSVSSYGQSVAKEASGRFTKPEKKSNWFLFRGKTGTELVKVEETTPTQFAFWADKIQSRIDGDRNEIGLHTTVTGHPAAVNDWLLKFQAGSEPKPAKSNGKPAKAPSNPLDNAKPVIPESRLKAGEPVNPVSA